VPAASAGAPNLFARLPLAFERNDGQFDGLVRFAARGDGYEVALGPNGARLALAEHGAAPREVGVRFFGGQPARAMTGVEALPGQTHYYRGNDPRAWTANVPTFGRVRAAGIYPGIDVEYYGRDRQLDGRVVYHIYGCKDDRHRNFEWYKRILVYRNVCRRWRTRF